MYLCALKGGGYASPAASVQQNPIMPFLCAKLPKTARKPCQNTRANGIQTQKNQQEPTDFLPA
ncbi:MAG: hypothetical protein IKW35_05145 [Paludibacteraceae bacterium]|nr:hypothetical protein [Paludibacteraceae bacterium]